MDQAPDALRAITESGGAMELIFLDADDQTLLRRYSQTRRRHPLSSDGRVHEGIAEERRQLKRLRAMAHTTIKTHRLSPHDLKRLITARYALRSPEITLSG